MSLDSRISISIVSHGQGALVGALLTDLSTRAATPIEALVTVNIPETLPFDPAQFAFPIRVMRNATPRGFGTNHNAAFREGCGDFFCVLNPDIRIFQDPFPALLECLQDPLAGVAAPLIVGPRGAVEDSARRFPTPWTILKKALCGSQATDYAVGDEPIFPDWLAGMFLLFRRDVFRELGGFDERYFLYYEDVDLCARLTLSGRHAVLCPAATAVHDARRQSRHSLRYLGWHLSSMLRYFAFWATRLAPARTAGRARKA